MNNALTRSALASAVLCAGTTAALAQSFSLEGAVIDSRSSQSLGVISERGGDINALFRAQKAMTFGILRSAGISLEQLPPDVRARIERFQTTNVEAFRAYSQGLDLKDQGRFVEARAFFRRATELDPGFALAAEQRQAMPDVNLGSGAQTRAIVMAAAGQAVDRGRNGVVLDAARAAAAISAGVAVTALNAVPTESALSTAGNEYTVNPAGSGGQLLPGLSVALTYNIRVGAESNFNLATPGEWRQGEFQVNGGVLDSVGSAASGFLAQRLGATAAPPGSTQLSDGTTAYWGTWTSAPGASAAVTLGNTAPIVAPELGPVHYVMGQATQVMPGSGTATYSAVGGSLGGVTGEIRLDFLQRQVQVVGLGFTIGSQTFSALNGQANYRADSGAGVFSGNYSSGSCSGCASFLATNSSFGGSFIGRAANGMAFSTFLSTDANNTAAGVHLFRKLP